MDKYYRILILLSEAETDGHVLAIFIAYDITEKEKSAIQKEKEQEQKERAAKAALQDAYEAAKRANAAKTVFLSNMSHDIRTPMNAIIGLTAIAETHLDDKDRLRDCLEKITVSSRHLLGLINEVLDMSKIEFGKVDLREENFNLLDVIDTLLLMTKSQAQEKGHELHFDIHDMEHEKVIGDVQRIQQVFMNLMGNAIKYTPAGGKIGLTVVEKPANQQRIGCYEFIFEDNGIGMSEEFLSQLFEPFERAKDERVGKIQGTGLGMTITKNIVEMMNGSIEVESELNKGTRIKVTIFLKLQDADETTSYEDLAGLSVLVVDNDELACEATSQMLEELGIKSEWYTSGQEAVGRAAERHEAGDDFFAVMIDWKMPDMDGVETTKQIRSLVGKEVPVIIISSYDWSDIEQQARGVGANAFLSKPLLKSRMAHLFHELSGKQEEEPKGSALEALAGQDFGGNRVLLAEDNEINAEIAGEILGMAGLEIEYAKDGKKAVDLFAASKEGYYDMIFMDIQMPLMNGYDAARAIRAMDRNDAKTIPVIAMTANAFADDVTAANAAGMNGHIAKPLDFQLLRGVLEKWLGRKESM